jgi:hypothetical protein
LPPPPPPPGRRFRSLILSGLVDWSVEGSGTSIQEEIQEAARETAASSKWKLLSV